MNVSKQDVKGLLAKLLATEDIAIQRSNSARSAAFDLKKRLLILPIWKDVSSDLEDMLLGHETGHALDTPVEEYKSSVENLARKIFGPATPAQTKAVRGFLNIIEDARIEKRQKRRYPGLRRNFLKGYKELLDRNFFGTKGNDLSSMIFIDKVNIYMKGGASNFMDMGLSFTPEEKLLVDKIEKLETFDETVTLTEEIYRYSQDQMQELLDRQETLGYGENEGEEGAANDGDGESGEGEGESGEGEGDGEDGDGESGEGEGESGEGEGDGEDGDGGSDTESDSDESSKGSGQNESKPNSGKNQKPEKVKGSPQRQGSPGANPMPASLTNESFEKKMDELVKVGNEDYIYVNFPKVDWNKAVADYKKVVADWKGSVAKADSSYGYNYFCGPDALKRAAVEFSNWKKKENETVSFMVSEFERKKAADIHARTQTAKTGIVDVNKIYSYKYNEDLFKRISVVPTGKNHGFVMFVDWSGSMNTNLKETVKQLLSLTLFCKRIQVPFEVYSFKDSNSDNPFITSGVRDCLQFSNVVLRNVLSSRMRIEEFNYAASVLWAIGKGEAFPSDSLGGTPLHEAIVLASQVVNEFRVKNKLEVVNTIFLTDGEGNHTSRSLANTNTIFSRSSRKTHYFYNDPETGKTYDLGFDDYNGYGVAQNKFKIALLNILKDRTQSNLVGFYLFDGAFINVKNLFKIGNDTPQNDLVANKFWNENLYYPVKDEGYDEYYIIDVRSLKSRRNVLNQMNIVGPASAAKLAKEFTRFTTNKTVNRVLLRNFIKKISGEESKRFNNAS